MILGIVESEVNTMSMFNVYIELVAKPEICVDYYFDNVNEAKAFIFDSLEFWNNPEYVHVGLMDLSLPLEQQMIICNG